MPHPDPIAGARTPDPVAALSPDDAARLVAETIACTLRTAADTLSQAVADNDLGLVEAAASLVRQAGWLADALARAHGGVTHVGDAAAWLLPPRVVEALPELSQAPAE